MANILDLEQKITQNVGLLTPPVDGFKRVEYSIASSAVRIVDDKTLDLGVYIKAAPKETYDSIETLWYGILPEIQTNIPNWQKAKKLLEFKHTITCNDRTITPAGNETPKRMAILDSLSELIDFYASLPSDSGKISRYSGRIDPKQSDFDTRLANERKFLDANKDALLARVFSKKEELGRIYAHHAKFAEGMLYRTDIRGVHDE